MKYYAIKDKESGKWVDWQHDDNELRYIEKDEIMAERVTSKQIANDRLVYLKNIASFRLDNKLDGIDVANLVVVPVEIKEVVDDLQEQAREYCVKALSDNCVYLPVKESKLKWYEIRPNQMVRLDKVEYIELYDLVRENNKRVWQVYLYCGHCQCHTVDLTEEEATAKYNELKKLLEEV